MLCAIIDNGRVIAIRELNNSEIGELSKKYANIIDIGNLSTAPEEGDTWDGLDFFDSQGNKLPRTLKKLITKLALRNRFTIEEKIILEQALSASEVMRAWYNDFIVSSYIDLSRPDTIAGINYLAQAGLITQERADTILNDPIQDVERYK